MIKNEPHASFVSTNTALYRDMRVRILRSVQNLIDTDFLHPSSNGPRADEIEKALGPYDPENNSREMSEEIEGVVLNGLSTGVALEALGDWGSALLWYRVGRYRWRRGPQSQPEDISAMVWKLGGPSMYQEDAGLCCVLAGDVQNANKILRWATGNRTLTEEEITNLVKEGNPQTLWQHIGFQISNLAWLGEWERILHLSEIGKRAVEKTRRGGYPKDFREPQLLIDIGRDLATYFTSPSEETFETAKKAVFLKNIPDRDPLTRINILPHLLALTRRYPELDPYPKSPTTRSGAETRLINYGSGASLEQKNFQQELDNILVEAQKKGKFYMSVSSIDLHDRVGGYPGKEHKMPICLQVMKKNMGEHDRLLSQWKPDNYLVVKYYTKRKEAIKQKKTWWQSLW